MAEGIRRAIEDDGGRRCQNMPEYGNDGQLETMITSLFEMVLTRSNMEAAAQQVVSNKGAPGIDGMTVDELYPYLERYYEVLVGKIRIGRYRPRPVRRVEIPKPGGGVRLLGIPSVVDRMVQQAIAQVLTPKFESLFSEHSYGFRPGRSAHDAVRKAKEYCNEGYNHVVDIDLAKYFDTVNHDLLIKILREVVQDEDLVQLIRKFLKSGVMKMGWSVPPRRGSPKAGTSLRYLAICTSPALIRCWRKEDTDS
jgi:group II intron reverse transcriptase/maturase